MVSIYDVLKASKGIHVEDSFAELWGRKLRGGYEIKTLTGVPPFTFTADGEPLIDWSMSGQTVQAGTPTPQNPVTVEGVGERTGNLFNVTDYSVGETSFVTKRITLEPNTAYTMSSNCPLYNAGALIAIGNVGESFSTANNGVYPNHPITRTTDANGELVIGLRTNGSDYTPADYETMLNSGSALPYEPYGYKLPLISAGQDVDIYLGESQTTRRIKKLVLTGSEDWTSFDQSGTTLYRCANSLTGKLAESPVDTMICNCLQAVSSRGACASTSNSISVYNVQSDSRPVVNVNPMTLSEWTTFIQQQYANGTPVTVWYALATEETGIVNEPLMKIGSYADEITKTGTGVDIPTVNGSNTLSVNTTVQPSEMSITFKGN